MGIIHTEITLINPRLLKLSPIKVRALVDTGSMLLCIPEHLRLQLELETNSRREVTVADGRSKMVDYVGPIEIRFGNRSCFAGALVLGDEVLLGAVPMEDMDLVISLVDRKVTVNPANPNFAHVLVK